MSAAVAVSPMRTIDGIRNLNMYPPVIIQNVIEPIREN